MTRRFPRLLVYLFVLASAVHIPAQTGGFKVIQP
ncbi:MAG: hypothetical protein QOJ42_123, partial [Acidobacteriaceae bacterium]|nr:hypothetical protein [Acidobacteriaceae bacterium]